MQREMKRTWIKRGKGFKAAKTSLGLRARSKAALRAGGYLKATAPLKKNGRRTNEWRKAWRIIKTELERRGRTRCEFSFIPHECFGRLDPCHSKKRRLMQGDDIYTVALGCAQAHRILDEVFTHAEMETAVLRAIQASGGLILPERKAA